ncbi:MAG: hypothetical protein HKO03_13185, partial [Acidimicrobiia bacterium]|nr:hypothetical protein [Acidimicrobiia bacterium]
MLSSIHPLGERARNQHWGLTVAAYVSGSTLGGMVTGLSAGTIGMSIAAIWRPPVAILSLFVAALAAAGLWADLGKDRLFTVRRQVNEDWLDEYRGWVYGIGFGFQLGLGWVTIITSSLVYLTFMFAALTASPPAGALVGLAFGFTRSLPVVLTARIRTPRQLVTFHRRMASWFGSARRMAATAQGLVSVTAIIT